MSVLEGRHLDAIVQEELCGRDGRVERVAEVGHGLERLERLGVAQLLLDGHEDVLLGELHARRHHRLEEGIVAVLAEARDLAGGGHLDAEGGVGALEALEGEHGRLDTHEILLGGGAAEGRQLLVAAHGPRGRLDEVDPEALGRKGEGARRAQVGLDDLDSVVLDDELHVVRPSDLESLGHQGGDALDLLERLGVNRLWGQHERRVARVHARVLDVLGDGRQQHLAVLRDSIHINLAAVFDKLGDNDRLVARHLGRVTEV